MGLFTSRSTCRKTNDWSWCDVYRNKNRLTEYSIRTFGDFGPIGKRTKRMNGFTVSQCCRCENELFLYPFVGEIECFNKKSAVVKIVSTHVADDHLVDKLSDRTVVSLKHLRVMEE